MTNTTAVETILEQLESPLSALLDRVAEAAGVEFSEEMTPEEIVALLVPHTTQQEVNTLVRIIDPSAKLTGKGITITTKLYSVFHYLYELQVEQEEKAMENNTTVPQEATVSEEDQQRRIQKSVDFINAKLGFEAVTIHVPSDVLRNMALNLKAQPSVDEQLILAAQAGYKEGIETAASQIEVATSTVPPTENKPVVNVVAIYDALKAKADEVMMQATNAVDAGDITLYNELMQKYREAMSKVGELGLKHKDKIFSPERSKAILDKARQSIAEGLRQSASATDKYGHTGVDGLISLANQVLSGVVTIAQTTINVTGQVGHAAVDVVSGVQLAAADLVEPKKN